VDGPTGKQRGDHGDQRRQAAEGTAEDNHPPVSLMVTHPRPQQIGQGGRTHADDDDRPHHALGRAQLLDAVDRIEGAAHAREGHRHANQHEAPEVGRVAQNAEPSLQLQPEPNAPLLHPANRFTHQTEGPD